jgi:hypothetical protein
MSDGQERRWRTMNTAEANRTWVRDLLWRKDRGFAETLDREVLSEVILVCPQRLRAACR